MALNDDQRKRMLELRDKADELRGNHGLFNSGSGWSLEEMAMLMFADGYIPVPTPSALLEAIDKSLDEREAEWRASGQRHADNAG